jgi:4-amino-4-deoxy-L-arabinose transferase-like glycosyltransferase
MALDQLHSSSQAGNTDRYLAAAIGLWIAAGLVFIFTLPLLPIDETRYMTVAWEMRQSGHWLLPTLNGAPYSHKPPLLIWLINLAWSFGGTEVGVARVIPLLITAGVLALTYRLARELFPNERETPSLAVMLTMMPVFYVYGSLLMFDQMLALWILLGLIALWRAAQAPSWKSGLLLGFAIGIGLLTKGPVILLHLLPPALLVRFWKAPEIALTRRQWSSTVIAAIAIGAITILAWAIPAAIVGGPEFAHMIFWRQSAGRIVQSFSHRQPFWFYVPVLIAMIAPLIVWRPLWRSVTSLWKPATRPVIFILSWIVPALIAFTAFSGKQPHYALPFLPGFAILAAHALKGATRQRGDAIGPLVLFAVAFLVLAFGPLIASAAGIDTPTGFWSEGLAKFNPVLTLLVGVAALAGLYLAQTIREQALAIALASGLLIATVAVQAQQHVFRFFDLEPFAAALHPYESGPIASASDYAGEIGYLARLTRPIDVIHREDMKEWFEKNPTGTVIVRHKADDNVPGFAVIYTMPYRPRGRFSIVRLTR